MQQYSIFSGLFNLCKGVSKGICSVGTADLEGCSLSAPLALECSLLKLLCQGCSDRKAGWGLLLQEGFQLEL